MTQHMEPMVFSLGGEPRISKLYRYTLCGLDNVYLCSGFTQEKINGEIYTSVKNAEDLHMIIALRLSALRRPLLGKEITFLRKQLRITQEELAKHFDVSRKTVSEYEREISRMPRPSQMLLQINVAKSLFDIIHQMHNNDDPSVVQFLPAIDEFLNYAITLNEAFYEQGRPELPPAFLADAAIGNWKMSRDGMC